MREARLMPGDPAPWFRARSSSAPFFNIDAAAGRWLALTFVDSSKGPRQDLTIGEIRALSGIFDDIDASWYIITADPGDEHPERLPLRTPGIRAIFDAKREIRGLYRINAWGALPVSVILTPQLSVAATIAAGAPNQHAQALTRVIAARPDISTLLYETRGLPAFHHTECP